MIHHNIILAYLKIVVCIALSTKHRPAGSPILVVFTRPPLLLMRTKTHVSVRICTLLILRPCGPVV